MLTPLEAIRKYCLWCSNHQPKEIELCPSKDCPFYILRFGKRHKGYSSLKAIREKCIDCSTKALEVKKCKFNDCSLYIYRFGTNPLRKGMGVIRNIKNSQETKV